MSDDEGKPAPIHPDEGDPRGENLVFRYNRERRLAHAPESVQRAYRDGYTPNRGFIRGLTSNAGLRSVFVTIIILCAVIVAIAFFGNSPGAASTGNCDLKLKAFLYEETVFVTIGATRSGISDMPIPLAATVRAFDPSGAVVKELFLKGVLAGTETETALRATMNDFEIQRISAEIQAGKDRVSLTVAVDRK